ncbi:hypothetical protein [Rubrolithibacter danxiaensis]|uniref:hypothetical protein n=1 Tax=Rubrolithibacter danxiaensis TaxID=3390805 RepID=UPI003BF8152C
MKETPLLSLTQPVPATALAGPTTPDATVLKEKRMPLSGSSLAQRKCSHCEEEEKTLSSKPVQRKLTVGAPDDEFEKEADRAAETIMRMPQSSFLQRKCAACEEDEKEQKESPADFIQKKEADRKLSAIGDTIQRKKYNGKDDAGFYEIDDKTCTFNYHQDWYFEFGDSLEASKQAAYMASGKRQVENGWSKKYQLIADNKSCACGSKGFSVDVKLNTLNQKREGKHGYTIAVEKDRERSVTNPVTTKIKMALDADTPKYVGGAANMDVMSHEFGHTIDLSDEYNWWAALWGVQGSGDKSSLMNRGNDVKPWHYQHFADILNLELGNCTYFPEGSVENSSLSEPVAQIGLTTGAFFKNATLDRSKAEFIIGLHIDRRAGNNAVLGLFYPTLGFDTYLNVKTNQLTMGPTTGLHLSRIQHPLYLDMSTGLLFTPENDKEAVKLNIPLSVTLGLRSKGFNAGINYTPMFDLLNSGKYSHIIGLNFQVDL